MGRRKINVVELGELLEQGKSTAEMAEHFHCTPRAVQLAVNAFRQSVTDYALRHHAKEKARQDLDAREQLLKINASANRILDLLEEKLGQDRDVVVAGLALQLQDLAGYGNGQAEQVQAIIKAIEAAVMPAPAIIDQLFKAQAEIRQQVGLLVKVAAELLEAQRVNEVHRIMLEEIKVESPECQSRIVRRLKGSNLLLTAVGWA